MLMRLVSPADTAHKSLGSIGLSVASFRDADGKLLPLVQIVDVLAKSLQGVDRIARDQVLGDVFGDRGIRVVGAFLDMGVGGFNGLADAMESNLPVAAKFEIMMSGLSGAFEKLGASVKLLSISFAKAIGSSLDAVVPKIQAVLNAFGALLERFPILAKVAAATAAAMVVLGAALVVGGIGMQVFGRTLGIVAKAIMLLATPMGATVAAVAGGIAAIVVAAYQLSPAFRKEADGIMAALSQLDFKSAWDIMNLNLAIAMTKMAAQVHGGLQRIGNFFTATGSVISDSLVGALDSFMGLFGADIITLQSGLQKLGVYLRAAFDWKFAVTGMRAAIAEVDAEAERARGRAPTAAARASQRTDRRADRAAGRGQAEEATMAGYDATVAELQADLDRVHAKLTPDSPASPTDPDSSVSRSQFRPPMPDAAVAATAAGKSGIGATLGTFAESAAGLGVGPELNKIEDYGRQTAANTGAAAAALAAMQAENLANPAGAATGLDGQPGNIVGPQLEAAMAGAAAAAAAGVAATEAAKPGGGAAGAAAQGIPAAGRAASAGAAAAGKSAAASSVPTPGFTDVVSAINAHAAISAAGNKLLEQIAGKIQNTQGAFA
jgi:hypothetical protein